MQETCGYTFFLLFFFIFVVKASLVDEVKVLCDIYDTNHPAQWLTSPCGWTSPCQFYLTGVNCTAGGNVWSLLVYVNFSACVRIY